MKTKKSFLWLAFLILATIWILVRHNQQVDYYSVKGLVFGTVYKITYQHDGDLKPEIEAELKRFDQSLSPFNDSSVISRVNRNEELVTDSFFQKCFHRSMEISRETKGAFDITVAPLANAWGFGFKKGAFPDSLMIDSLLQITGYEKVKMDNGKVIKHPVPHDILQTAYITRKGEPMCPPDGTQEKPDIILHSHEACLKDKKKQAENFRFIEEESNKYEASRILQDTGNETVVVNPPYPPMSQGELDHSFDLPYTRMPHPKYKGKRIPAFDMIKFSVNLHRGCFGGCAFCTISAHQGKFIVSRSKESILREVRAITEMPDFKGYLSDLGGPSANMYAMRGKDEKICRRCKRPSCIHPKVSG